jgi:hypothetical protein
MLVFRVLCCQTTSDLDTGARSPLQTAQSRLRQRGDRVVLAGYEPLHSSLRRERQRQPGGK